MATPSTRLSESWAKVQKTLASDKSSPAHSNVTSWAINEEGSKFCFDTQPNKRSRRRGNVQNYARETLALPIYSFFTVNAETCRRLVEELKGEQWQWPLALVFTLWLLLSVSILSWLTEPLFTLPINAFILFVCKQTY